MIRIDDVVDFQVHESYRVSIIMDGLRSLCVIPTTRCHEFHLIDIAIPTTHCQEKESS